MSDEEHMSVFAPPDPSDVDAGIEDHGEKSDKKSNPTSSGVDSEDALPQKEEVDTGQGKKRVESKKETAPFNPLVEKKEAEPEDIDTDNNDDGSGIEKRFKETQNALFSHQRKEKTVLKIIAEAIDSGEMDEESGNKLLSAYSEEAVDDVINELRDEKQNKEHYLLQKVIQTVKKELPMYKKYSSEENLDKHLYSFERFYAHDANKEDQQFIIKELFEKNKDDPTALLKNMAKAGKNIYEGIYKIYEDAGGIHAITQELTKVKRENETLRQKLKGERPTTDSKKTKYNLSSGHDYGTDSGYTSGDSQSLFAPPK